MIAPLFIRFIVTLEIIEVERIEIYVKGLYWCKVPHGPSGVTFRLVTKIFFWPECYQKIYVKEKGRKKDCIILERVVLVIY